jgi:hypothetical protein
MAIAIKAPLSPLANLGSAARGSTASSSAFRKPIATASPPKDCARSDQIKAYHKWIASVR